MDNFYQLDIPQKVQSLFESARKNSFYENKRWPINIWEQRKLIPDINSYLFDLIKISNEGSIDDFIVILQEYFTFDDSAKEFLTSDPESQTYFRNNDISFTKDSISHKKYTKILQLNEALSLDIKHIADTVWDLYYDTLVDFLANISLKTQDPYLQEYIFQPAIDHIQKSREICKLYTDKTDETTPHFQAENLLKQRDMSKIISFLSGKSNEKILQDFLINLSNKLKQDWENDWNKGRKQLSNQLMAASHSLIYW